MKNPRNYRILNNEKGISAILIAGIMFFLVFMVGLAVDMGFMYVVKGQLQNAADAGALAGVTKLKPHASVFEQYSAKSLAKSIAECNNVAECKPFVSGLALNTDMSANDITSMNDIVVGNWDSTRLPHQFLPDSDGTPIPAGAPINAIKVRARRTTDSPKGQVNLFFSKALSVVGYNWSKMSTAAEAIAIMEPGKILPIMVNEYWLEDGKGQTPYGPTQKYPNSFARITNVDGTPSTMHGKIFAILGEDADDNLPSQQTGGGSHNVNGFVNLDARSSNHDGLGTTWYSVNTSGTGSFSCTSCSNFFSPSGGYDPSSGDINSVKFNTSLGYLLNGYPDNLPPPTAVKEQYRSNYPQPNYPVNPTSSCPYATMAYFSQSGKAPLNKSNANGQYFKDIYPAGAKIITLVYDGTFNPTTDPNAPNALTAVGYIALQIDGYASGNPSGNNGLTSGQNNTVNTGFLGPTGNTVYAHAISDIVEPSASGAGGCDPSFINALRSLTLIAGKAKLVK